MVRFKLRHARGHSGGAGAGADEGGSRGGGGKSMLGRLASLLQTTSPAILLVSGITLLLLPLSLHIVYTQWDRAVLRAPVCRAAVPASHLPKLVIFLGPEGAGHDLFEYIFSALPTPIALERFDPELHLTADEAQETPVARRSLTGSTFCPKLPYARRVHDFGAQISAAIKDKAEGGGQTYVRVRDPFPMGRIRTPLARPDPVALGMFHGIYYDLKAIVLVRNVTKMAMWSISRHFHNEDVGLQLRLVEDSLLYLDASVRTLPCGTYAIVDVDQVHENHAQAASQLASFLNLPKIGPKEVAVAMQVGFSRWNDAVPKSASAKSEPQPTFGGQRMEFFFSQRTALWPLLDSANLYPVFAPRSPFAWPRR